MYPIVVAATVVAHLAFLAYLVVGGFVALRFRRSIGVHVVTVIWGIAITAWPLDCPLTGLERWARDRGAMAPLPPDGFVAHYVTGVLYPAGWVNAVQIAVFAVVAASWLVYGVQGRRRLDRKGARG
ncbi:DUF2784 domain-containing protein [Mycolicibacillus parakoreensis]|uniref:DUF2784 domain-containing protein n=2 Tax=Mycobacteriaceae TaxID=1762 RepID=A0ABY3U2G6_9MYCO|nr:DUF2784 domain-containing protein [Mycolicibacillus parakoreensis]MCV7313981.1 DUF2784 domain-containing protein [Mycolicibacillus parakoreensis]ULN54150.1 DUF2784 domain-containing protein [Mycolicibacillus parakoreensis]